MIKLVIATTNEGKFREIVEELKQVSVQLQPLSDFRDVPESPETGRTFAENAKQKADFYFEQLQLPVLAEDSGLMIPVLGDFPGLHSARVASTDSERIQIVLERLRNASDRSAYYVCQMVLKMRHHVCLAGGTCHGRITQAPKGEQGFGYDPIFQPDGGDLTFGEMTPGQKSSYSHRGQAARYLLPCLLEAIAKGQ